LLIHFSTADRGGVFYRRDLFPNAPNSGGEHTDPAAGGGNPGGRSAGDYLVLQDEGRGRLGLGTVQWDRDDPAGVPDLVPVAIKYNMGYRDSSRSEPADDGDNPADVRIGCA
jgi:hypothetical protein